MLAEAEVGGPCAVWPELKPGCLHCSPDTGTDSGSVQRGVGGVVWGVGAQKKRHC